MSYREITTAAQLVSLCETRISARVGGGGSQFRDPCWRSCPFSCAGRRTCLANECPFLFLSFFFLSSFICPLTHLLSIILPVGSDNKVGLLAIACTYPHTTKRLSNHTPPGKAENDSLEFISFTSCFLNFGDPFYCLSPRIQGAFLAAAGFLTRQTHG